MNQQFFRRPLRLRRSDPWVILGLMALLVIVYLADTVSGWINSARYSFSAYGWPSVLGMKDNRFIVAGEWWRLITANFLHGGLQHIAFNLFSLYIWGRFVENIFGHGRTAMIVLGSALMTTAVSFALSPNNSLGASGIAFGLMGALFAFGFYNKTAFARFFGGGMTAMVVVNLLYGFFASSIDSFGHLGGLVGGFLAGMVAGGMIRRSGKEAAASALAFIVTFMIMIMIGFKNWG